MEALSDPVARVRSVAAVGLGTLGAKQAGSTLKPLLRDENPGVRAACVSALLRLGRPYKEVADTVQGLTQDKNPGMRSSAARALSQGRGRVGVGVLSLLLRDPVPRPRIAATRALGRVGGRDVIGLLKQALRDRDQAVQATAGGALVRVLSEISRGSVSGTPRL